MVYKVYNNEGFLFSFLGGRFNLRGYLISVIAPLGLGIKSFLLKIFSWG